MNKKIKFRSDYTFPLTIIFCGSTLILPVLISRYSMTTFGILWEICCTFIILMAVWKFEHFEISEDILTKVNFGGLYRKDLNLRYIIKYKKKVTDMNHFRNPFNIIKLFCRDEKYFKFRTIKIYTTNNSTMVINEKNMYSEDFKKLQHIIKTYQKQYGKRQHKMLLEND
ncbi:hypothetical protein QE382_003490 [Sphingobacterium zeae]|uniref:PH domain-containing protein n=2 Tax=Sphingobacterium zeae TaxID=1776859 RepID=A0ABU0U9G8_9SPHI|nr:hypothetical protein [Sphingobacterium zeae]